MSHLDRQVIFDAGPIRSGDPHGSPFSLPVPTKTARLRSLPRWRRLEDVRREVLKVTLADRREGDAHAALYRFRAPGLLAQTGLRDTKFIALRLWQTEGALDVAACRWGQQLARADLDDLRQFQPAQWRHDPHLTVWGLLKPVRWFWIGGAEEIRYTARTLVERFDASDVLGGLPVDPARRAAFSLSYHPDLDRHGAPRGTLGVQFRRESDFIMAALL